MSDDRAKAKQWQTKHMYVKVLRCPECNSPNLKTVGTKPPREVGILSVQQKRCKDCRHTFQIHWE